MAYVHMCVQVQVLVYIFFEKGRVPVGGRGARGRGEQVHVREQLLLQWMKGVGEGCLKSKMNLDWAKFDLESPKNNSAGSSQTRTPNDTLYF